MENRKRLRGRPKNSLQKTTQPKIQSLDRAIAVLEYLAAQNGKTLTEISEALSQSPATIHRILTTFESHQSVEMHPETQEWHVGAGSFRIGSAFLRRTGIVERARPIMRALMLETGETANLGIENGTQVLFLSQVETHENIRAFFPPGTLSPMHASGIGKALLAFADEPKIDAYFKAAKFQAFTENTICSKDALKDELARIKSNGFSFDNEEKSIGMRCVASPVFNNYGEVIAGISISGPSARLSLDQIDDVSVSVMKNARILSQSLGYQT